MLPVHELVQKTDYIVAQYIPKVNHVQPYAEGVCDTVHKILYVPLGMKYTSTAVHETVHCILDSFLWFKPTDAEHEIMAQAISGISMEVKGEKTSAYDICWHQLKEALYWWSLPATKWGYGSMTSEPIDHDRLHLMINWFLGNDYVPEWSYFPENFTYVPSSRSKDEYTKIYTTSAFYYDRSTASFVSCPKVAEQSSYYNPIFSFASFNQWRKNYKASTSASI